ncbi:MAG: hypothetical protein HQL87_07160 [Magnetococcales bacterium]|nr:hypothetical protein [Magnetococcales bacterium]
MSCLVYYALLSHPNNSNGKSMKKILIRSFILSILLGALGTGLFHLYLHRNEESTDDAAINGDVVTISAKVAGYVKILNIDDNQAVKVCWFSENRTNCLF